MISTDKKFIFVAVMKTGTMSIAKTLEKYSLDKDGSHYTAEELKMGKLTSHSSIKAGNNNSHISLYKKHWDEYFTFGFVRNPWDHFVSFYKWCSRHNSPLTSKGFGYFLKSQYDNKFNSLWDWNFTCQTDRLFQNDKQIVDFVGRFENLEEDFEHICDKIGILESLCKINFSKDRSSYKKFYKTSEDKEMIQQMYLKDIERFKYEFE